MNTTAERKIFIDDRVDSYAHFYDHARARQLDDLTEGTKIEHAVMALCSNWKAASNTMRLPWLTVATSSEISLEMAKKHHFAPAFIRKAADVLPDRLNLRGLRKLTAGAIIHEIGEGMETAAERARSVLSKESLWKAFFIDKKNRGRHEFQLAVWGSQQIGYGAIYFAYENFIQECVGVAKDDPTYRMKNVEMMKKDVLELLGQAVVDACVTDDRVNIARLVRSDLVHNGGRPGAKLNELQHDIIVVDGVLQIHPVDSKQLIELLQDKAYKFAEAVLEKLG